MRLRANSLEVSREVARVILPHGPPHAPLSLQARSDLVLELMFSVDRSSGQKNAGRLLRSISVRVFDNPPNLVPEVM
jgi:hypothetical protein